MGDFDFGGLVCASLVLAPPGLFLLAGWRALHVRQYGRADTCATLAGILAGVLVVMEGPVVLLIVAKGIPVWKEPLTMALLSYPPWMWYFSRRLHDSVRRRQDEDIRARRERREDERREAGGQGSERDSGP